MAKKLAYIFLCLSTLLFIAVLTVCQDANAKSKDAIILLSASLILGSSLIALAITSLFSNKDKRITSESNGTA